MKKVLFLIGFFACAHTPEAADEKDQINAKIRYDIAINSLNNGDTRNALRELLQAVQLDPSLAEAHQALGLVYHALDQKEDGLTHYKKAVELKPKFSEAHNNMGILLIDLGRYDEAIQSFEIALSDILYATPSLAEGNMGWAYYRKGDVEKGIKHISNAVATSPSFCRGYEWLARIGLDTQKPDQVLKSYARFEKYCLGNEEIASLIAPAHISQMQYYAALGFLKQGDEAQARKMLTTCSAQIPESEFSQKCVQSLSQLGK